ncbi:MAG: RNA polymerase sigma factor [Jatrophihabitans sp.]|uniref:RNA polymerase sigma factor n=1 Tax=Jatrophihabitans sp. TaxID=1932789 RepID=UPI003F80E804
MVVGARSDDVLVARLLAGDETALAIVFAEHGDLVYGLARRVTRDEHLAHDITQEVFAGLWQRPDKVDLARGSLRTFLAMVTHGRSVDEVRRSERRQRLEAVAPEVDAEDGPDVSVVDAAAERWRSSRLAAGLAALPSEQRRAVQLAYFEGLTYRQVAAALGIPEGTAKSRLRLALGRLRGTLGDDLRLVTG